MNCYHRTSLSGEEKKKKKKKKEKKEEDKVLAILIDEEDILYDVNTLEFTDVNMTNKDPTIPTPVPPQ